MERSSQANIKVSVQDREGKEKKKHVCKITNEISCFSIGGHNKWSLPIPLQHWEMQNQEDFDMPGPWWAFQVRILHGIPKPCYCFVFQLLGKQKRCAYPLIRRSGCHNPKDCFGQQERLVRDDSLLRYRGEVEPRVRRTLKTLGLSK